MSDLSLLSSAIVLGVALACGLLLIARRVPRWAAPSLTRRISPYVRDIADPAGLTPLQPAPAVALRLHMIDGDLGAIIHCHANHFTHGLHLSSVRAALVGPPGDRKSTTVLLSFNL